MTFAIWSAVIGLLLVVMAMSVSVLSRLPLSTSMLYLTTGVVLSPIGFGLASLEPLASAGMLERIAEVAVLLSLFTSGLKMSVGMSDGRWFLPVRLALGSMVVTVGLITAAGVWLIGLPLGAAVLLGAILAPTDPVLASEVQLGNPEDRDKLRFSLTGEAGLNDGTAFPFVMLGLGLLGLHELGAYGWRWFAVDVVWAMACGIGVGAAAGTLVGKYVLHLRRQHGEAVGLDNFLALGVIGLSYGLALLAHGYGFLAVFAAGVAFRRVERMTSAEAPALRQQKAIDMEAANALLDPVEDHVHAVATDSRSAAAFMAHAVLSFNEQLERIGEVAAVIIIGMLLWAITWQLAPWWFVAILLLFIRPASVLIGLAGSRTSMMQRALMGWFGIRGIGSLYYLMYAITHGVEGRIAEQLVAITLVTVTVSIALHGVSVTPLMSFYERSKKRMFARRR